MSAATDWKYSTFCQFIYLQYNIHAYSVKINKMLSYRRETALQGAL